jgi:hypothetical protein
MWFVNRRPSKILILKVGWHCGWEDKALQECNLSAWPSMDCECIRPGTDLVLGVLFFSDRFASHG